MDRLRCFIAMRFGESQTDKVYDSLIKTTLKQLNIAPIRVDRLEHNDSIDQRIIYELEKCELAIADLTFARPSVYFEAGFAQGEVPVIYTSRKDHLKPRDSDKYGNFRVHFDLQMKNIIPWLSENDFNFARRLKARIKKVVRPILSKKSKLEEENKAADRFSRLSMQDRVRRIYLIGLEQLKAFGFRETKIPGLYPPHSQPFVRNATVLSISWSNVTKAHLQREYGLRRREFTDFQDLYSKRRNPSSKQIHLLANWIVCAQKKLTPARMHEIFPHVSQEPARSTYLVNDPFLHLRHPNIFFYIHAIDGIKSEDDCRTRMKSLIDSIRKKAKH